MTENGREAQESPAAKSTSLETYSAAFTAPVLAVLAALIALFTLDSGYARPIASVILTITLAALSSFFIEKGIFDKLRTHAIIGAGALYFSGYITIDLFDHLQEQQNGDNASMVMDQSKSAASQYSYVQFATLLDADDDGKTDVYRRLIPNVPVTLILPDGVQVSFQNETGITNSHGLPAGVRATATACGYARSFVAVADHSAPGNPQEVELLIPSEVIEECAET